MSNQDLADNGRMGRLSIGLAVAASLAALAVLLALGTWQVQRLQWKEALIATIDSRIHSAPVPLDDALAAGAPLADLEYTPVTLEGTFVHAAERHFFATWKGASGFFVYTPLLRADGGHVFVNRGFVPYDRKDPATRPESLVEGQVAVTGLLRAPLTEKPSAILPDNDPAGNMFYWKDLEAMEASSGLPADAAVMGVFVDADATPNAGWLPIGGVTIVDLPNNHLQYAVTWYGLAAALAAVLGAWLWRNLRR
jgi:surfeit locus 1 family protein